MTRHSIFQKLIRLIGRKNTARLQMAVKYVVTFRKVYTADSKTHCNESFISPPRVVFIIDGKTPHGGLSDRLRGLFSIYYYCKQRGYTFKVAWNYPFKLEDYLMPVHENWVADEADLTHDKKVVDFRFFNNYVGMSGHQADYFSLLDFKKPICHVYSSITQREDLYPAFFQELFKPAPRLEQAISQCLQEIGGKYITVSFRFIGILGDFKDHAGFGEELTVEEKRYYIKKSLACLEQLHMRHPQCYKIVVTTDSPYFLKLVKSLSYVYVIPGRLEHMDYAVVDDYEVHLKTFLDFMIITKAEKSYSYQYGKMYGATKFALTAALIGNNEYEVVKD